MNDHYFSNRPDAADRRREVRFQAWGHDFELTTASSVFAADGLDKATGVLLRHTDPPQPGSTVLDLGCGWGPIACALAVASPGCTVWAVDVNERGLELTRANAERIGASVAVARPDDVPADVVFDAIWSNPPIRVGKEALHDVLLRWLHRLAPGGRMHLVVGRNLGADSLHRWLTEQGWATERRASEQGFRVLEVQRG